MSTQAEASSDQAPARYGRGAATLHWVSAILIIGLLLQGFFMTKFEDSATKTLFYQLHVSLGYVVIILSIARVWWARRDSRPDPLDTSAVEGAGFKWVHYLLVLGALLTAFSGIILLVGSGILPISPAVTAAEVDRALPVRNAHFLFALGMVILLIAHLAGGVLYQRRSGQTFGRMRWPRQSPDVRAGDDRPS